MLDRLSEAVPAVDPDRPLSDDVHAAADVLDAFAADMVR